MCNGFVAFLAERDLPEDVRFATQDSEAYRELVTAHPPLAELDTVVVHERYAHDYAVYTKAEAVTRVLDRLGGIYPAVGRVRALLPGVANFVYDAVAARRPKYDDDACPVPPPAVRERLIA